MTLNQTIYRGQVRGYTKTSEEDEQPTLVSFPEQAVIALCEWYRSQAHQGWGLHIPERRWRFCSKGTIYAGCSRNVAARADVKPKIKKRTFRC